MSLRRNLIRDTLLYGIGDILVKAIAFLLIPLYTKSLLPAEYGVYQLIVIFITVSMVFALGGMNVALFRHFVVEQSQRRRRELFTATVVWVAASSAIIIVISYLLSKPLSLVIAGDSGRIDLVGLGALSAGLDTLLLVLLLIFRMEKHPGGYVTYSLLKVILIIVGNYFLVWRLGMGVVGILIAGIAADLVILAPLLYRVGNYFIWPIPRKLVLKMLAWGLPFVPASLATVILTLSDRLILRYMVGFDQAGIYSVGYKIAGAVLLLYTAFRFAWGPYMFELAQNGETARRTYPRVLNVLVAVLGFFALALVAISPELFEWFVGKAYWSARAVLIPISLSVLFDAMSLFFGAALQTRDRTIYIPVVTGFVALLNILLNIWLIPRYGFMGAAWATFVSYVALAYMNYRIANPLMPVEYQWGRIFASFAVVVVGMAVVWFVGPLAARIGLVIAIGALLYCICGGAKAS